MGLPTEKNMIYYFSPSQDLYVYAGKGPLVEGSSVPEKDIVRVNSRG